MVVAWISECDMHAGPGSNPVTSMLVVVEVEMYNDASANPTGGTGGPGGNGAPGSCGMLMQDSAGDGTEGIRWWRWW